MLWTIIVILLVLWVLGLVSSVKAGVGLAQILLSEQAGEYALDTFDLEWHPIIEEAVAYWLGELDEARVRVPADQAARVDVAPAHVLAHAIGAHLKGW